MNDKLLIGDDIMRKYFCIALILVLSISLVGCFYFSPQPKPIDTVVTFFDSINNKDINTAVSCLEPKYQRLFNLTNKIIGAITGVNLSDILDLAPFLSFLADYFPEIKEDPELPIWVKFEIIEVITQSIDGKEATIIVKVRGSEVNFITEEILNSEIAIVSFNLKNYSNDGWKIVNATPITQ
ncbi:MAG: hypothetical protein KBH94_00575 [Caldisericia bacterium]|nr:hypothetical protein [Caldisericia bacterium]